MPSHNGCFNFTAPRVRSPQQKSITTTAALSIRGGGSGSQRSSCTTTTTTTTATTSHFSTRRRRRSVMFISFLWPEVTSSAAGVRTNSLLRAFQGWDWDVHFVASAKPNQHTESLAETGVATHNVGPNRGAQLEAVLRQAAPDVVVFDRFMAEEAFSFRVRSVVPSAARVLDMQDLHALRYARQALVVAASGSGDGGGGAEKEGGAEGVPLIAAAAMTLPDATDSCLCRELAAVHRSDLTLVCSPVEQQLLQEAFQVPAHKLVPASFFCDDDVCKNNKHSVGVGGSDSSHQEEPVEPPLATPAVTTATSPGFDERSGFMTIGTFFHPPNVDSVQFTAAEVWPLIRQRLPSATMHVYGAYPTPAVQHLHNPDQGFFVDGFAPSVDGVMARARVLLAPLRFGAGIKGKIVDAWRNGLPVVTTPIGSEGMLPGRVGDLYRHPHDGGSGDADVNANGTASSSPQAVSPAQSTAIRRTRRRRRADSDWGGRWEAVDAAGVAADAVALHDDRTIWEQARSRGTDLVSELFSADANLRVVRRAVEELLACDDGGDGKINRDGLLVLERRRCADFVGGALWHHSLRSTEYFSRWIELKETAAAAAVAAAGVESLSSASQQPPPGQAGRS